MTGDLGEADLRPDAAPGLPGPGDRRRAGPVRRRPARSTSRSLVPVALRTSALAAARDSLPRRAARPRPGDAGSAGPSPGTPPRPVAASWPRRLRGLPAAEQDAAAARPGRAQVAAVLGHASARRSSRTGVQGPRLRLADRGRAAQPAHTATGLRLPATLIFDYPTPAALAGYLRARARAARWPSDCRAASAAPARSATTSRSSIVGMGCRFPGGVASPEELWDLVADGPATRSRRFPTDRGWDLEALYDPDPTGGHDVRREGGFLARRRASSTPASSGSRRARRWPWIRSSGCCWRPRGRRSSGPGIDPPSLRGQPTGVFAGVIGQRLRRGTARAATEASRATSLTGSTGERRLGPGRLHPRPRGPGGHVDTACSSSLVALHLAAQALRSGECDLALAGGVDGDGHPGHRSSSSPGSGGLAAGRPVQGVRGRRGRHRLGRGRRRAGAGAAVRRAAQRPPGARGGTRLAVNQDGASNGLTAPNGPSQQRVIRQALADAGLIAVRRGRGRGARHRHHAGRPDRGAGAAGHLRPGPRRSRAAVAGLGEVEHRPHPGRRRRGRA